MKAAPRITSRTIFPVLARPSDDGDHNDQDGLEQVCFFEEGGLFEHKKDAGERLVEKKVMLYKSC